MYLAELFGGNAKIERDGSCSIIPLKNYTNIEINALTSKKFEIGETYQLTRVCYNNLIKWYGGGNVITVDELPTTDIDTNSHYYLTTEMKYYKYNNGWYISDEIKNTLFIRPDNIFISREEQIWDIHRQLMGFSVTNITCENKMDLSLDAWDIVKYVSDEGEYYTFYDNTINYNGATMGTVKVNIPLKLQEETTNVLENQKVINRRVQATINQIDGSINLLSQEVSENTENIAELELTASGISTRVTNLSNNLSNNYSTTTQMNSAITQTASSIRTEVNKKVNSSDFGTLIEQNYSHVRIAWNNISEYIQFENAQLNIYDSSNYKLLSLNRYGIYLYSSGTKFGTMSLSTWEGSSYKRGLMFNLDMEGYYEGWGRKTSSSSSSYTVALVYSRANGAYTEDGLHMGVPLYTHGQPIYFDTNKYVRTVSYSNAAAIRVTSGSFYIERSNGGDILKFDWDGRLEVHSEMTMYANLQLNGNSVWLDGNTIHVSSDKRLKKNIKPVNVSALDKISQLKVKEFDWKANNDHVNAGFIAQELKEIFPDLVKENPTKKEIDGKKINSLAISYEGLIPYLVKAIQELKSIIDKEKKNGK